MAQGTTTLGGKVIILLGDGANPENFSAALGGTTKTFTRNTKTQDFAVPDNDDPDAAVWVDRIAASLDWTLSVDGYLEVENVDVWDSFFEQSQADLTAQGTSAGPKNIRIRFTGPAALAGRTYAGAAICQKLEHKSEIQKKVMVSVTLQGTGPLTRTTTSTPSAALGG